MSKTNTIHENDQLDQALLTDPLLVESLQAESRVHHRRIRNRSIGLLMAVFIVSIGILAIQPGFASPGEDTIAKGWRLWKERKWTESEKIFLKATKEAPNSIDAWNGLGWSQLNQGKSSAALITFEKCLELNPVMPTALNGAGQALMAQRKYDKAKIYLLKAAPQANAAWFSLARISLLQKDYESAEEWAGKLTKIHPENEIAKRILNAAREKSVSEELLGLVEPPSPASQQSLQAWDLFRTGKMVEAKEQFEKVIKNSPDDFHAINGLAFCHLNLGEVADAKPLFQKCLKNQKNAFGAMNGLARCLKSEGKLDEAIALWEKMDKIVGNVSAATVGLAYAYMEQGDYKSSKIHFEKLALESPQSSEYQKRLKVVAEELKKVQ